MLITKIIVADKIAAYLHHDITLAQLVDWAERAMMEDEFEENGLPAIRSAISRLGVADVRAFGLTWEDCEDLLSQLGFSARVSIIAAKAGTLDSEMKRTVAVNPYAEVDSVARTARMKDKVSAAERLKAFMLSDPVRGVDIKALLDRGIGSAQNNRLARIGGRHG